MATRGKHAWTWDDYNGPDHPRGKRLWEEKKERGYRHPQERPERAKLFDDICTELAGADTKKMAVLSEVSLATLYNWKDGTTRRPRLDTLSKVAAALGYELTLTPTQEGNVSHLRVVNG